MNRRVTFLLPDDLIKWVQDSAVKYHAEENEVLLLALWLGQRRAELAMAGFEKLSKSTVTVSHIRPEKIDMEH